MSLASLQSALPPGCEWCGQSVLSLSTLRPARSDAVSVTKIAKQNTIHEKSTVQTLSMNVMHSPHTSLRPPAQPGVHRSQRVWVAERQFRSTTLQQGAHTTGGTDKYISRSKTGVL